jgi:hypothetical protein
MMISGVFHSYSEATKRVCGEIATPPKEGLAYNLVLKGRFYI